VETLVVTKELGESFADDLYRGDIQRLAKFTCGFLREEYPEVDVLARRTV
jgi:hypothetical protein